MAGRSLPLTSLPIWARVIALTVTLVLLLGLGTAGFMLLEGYRVLEAVWMATITLTTVGFGEIHPLSDAGRVFVIVYLLFGLGAFTFGAVQLAEIVLRGQLRDWLGKRRMNARLTSLNEHFIVCGGGRMGRTICQGLHAGARPFVVIDSDESVRQDAEDNGWLWLFGDATDDRVLDQAGVTRARSLASVLPDDADNLYVVMSARLLAPKLRIVARATEERAVEKMKRAGADRVVSPYTTGAHRMTQLLVNPQLEDFLEIVVGRYSELDIAEVRVSRDSTCFGRRLGDAQFSAQGIVVVGVKRADGTLDVPPPEDRALAEGDLLIVLGKDVAIATLLAGKM